MRIPLLLSALAVALLSACNQSDSGTGPSANETKVTGTWVASQTFPDASGKNHVLGLQMIIQGNKSYQRSGKIDGVFIARESGTWSLSGDQFKTHASLCEEADPIVNPTDGSTTFGPLNIRVCEEPDETTTVNIQSTQWTMNDTDSGTGEVTSYTFSKL